MNTPFRPSRARAEGRSGELDLERTLDGQGRAGRFAEGAIRAHCSFHDRNDLSACARHEIDRASGARLGALATAVAAVHVDDRDRHWIAVERLTVGHDVHESILYGSRSRGCDFGHAPLGSAADMERPRDPRHRARRPGHQAWRARPSRSRIRMRPRSILIRPSRSSLRSARATTSRLVPAISAISR